jgi:hypothetical protein
MPMRTIPVALALACALLTACGGGGSGSSGSSTPPPTPAAPKITYSAANIALTTQTPVTLAATNTGGAATGWTISPALPGGLTFSATTGSISGMSATALAPATYAITATNAGGSDTFNLTLSVQTVLLDLGHTAGLVSIGLTPTRVLSQDIGAHWVLWNYATAAEITTGNVPCPNNLCDVSIGSSAPTHAELDGPTAVIEMPTSLEVISSVDGSALGTVNASPNWWHLASDGSYVCGGSKTALTAWAPNGTVIASRPGDYSQANAFCAPGTIRVALGAAGADVIESVALPAGTSIVGPPFAGTFNQWFADGGSFLTSVGDTISVYSNASVELEITVVTLATSSQLGGEGNWFWTYDGVNTLSIYQVGGGTNPTATYTYGFRAPRIAASGSTLGVMDAGTVHQIDLSGATPVDTDYAMPVQVGGLYVAVSPTQWMVAGDGVLLDGMSVLATPRFFGYGDVWGIAGSSARVAIATASGQILSFNASTWALEGSISQPTSQLALSSDGTVLATRTAGDKGVSASQFDASVRTFSMPAGTLINVWPYTFETIPWPMDISLSSSGALLGQVTYTNSFSESFTRQVTASSGGATLWTDTVSEPLILDPFLTNNWPVPVRLSPDDTLIAVSSSKDQTAGTNIYLNDTLAAALPGWAVGWLANDELLQSSYTGSDPAYFASSAVYSSAGIRLSATTLPQLGSNGSIQLIGTDSVYDPGTNAIYSVATGKATWTGPPPSGGGTGAVAAGNVVFVSGNTIAVQPY